MSATLPARRLSDFLTGERIFILIGVAHMLLRLIFHLLLQPDIHGAEDLDIARHLARGEGFSIYDRGPTTAKGPFYPALLALFIRLGAPPENLWPVALLQHLMLAWMPLLLYRLGNAMGLAGIGSIAGWLFALHPSFLYYPTVLENTSIFIFLTAIWALGLYRLRERLNPAWMGFIGVWWGLMWIEKPVAFLPMTAAALLLLSWRRWIRLLPIAFIPVGLWALRGYLTFGYPTWTKTFAGQHTFAMSWHPDMAIAGRYTVSTDLAHQMDSLFLLPEDISGPIFARMGREIFHQQGLLRVAERTLLQALIFWWIPPRYWGDNSVRIWFARKLPVLLINALFLLGLLYGWKRYRRLTAFILLSSLYVTLFYAANHVLNIRYRLDVEWLQLYVCAMGIEGLFRWQKYTTHSR